jgi:2,4-dienoyl-CoA reductase-like NADH-dependent reductase (Old Yellow Enzyme family)
VVEAVKRHDGRILLQLMHAGALSQHLSNTRAPSRITPMRSMLNGYSRKQGQYPTPHAMNLSEIDQVKAGYLAAATAAEEAGFDGVEIHAANGYLLDQFITEYTNIREDSYGGSVENRIRLCGDIIRDIRHQQGDDFLISVRLSQGKVNDFNYLWGGGCDDGNVIFRAVDDAGASCIHFASEGKGFDHGCLTRERESLPRLARESTGLPVIANGGLHVPEEAARILRDGHADLIALGTGALANPDWPLRLAKGQDMHTFSADFFRNGVNLSAQENTPTR